MLYLKALHIIFVVTWFAGLFYLGRLFIYYAETEEKPREEQEVLKRQYRLMISRLWKIITMPSMVLVILFGFWMVWINPAFLSTWLYVKLGFVTGLVIYHFICGSMVRSILDDTLRWRVFHLRLWNELATLFLFAIVFLAVLKDSIRFMYGLAGLLLLALLLWVGILLYKRLKSEG